MIIFKANFGFVECQTPFHVLFHSSNVQVGNGEFEDPKVHVNKIQA